ncbi:MAG: type II toxin-antitoxin system HipA family toxin YjjJ [Opitutaceae bacterium]|nr:type II toxin-antitoxin system HipA family toxin YjjJ [Opitutaceae bacterium]
MPRPPLDPNRVALRLQTEGVTSARSIATALRISPATLNRCIGLLGPAVERIGAARSTRYALRRTVRNLGDRWPIYRIGNAGRPRVWGELRALHRGFRFVPAEPAPAWMQREYMDGLFSGLPFFLQDMRPQGYMGRAIARDVAARLMVPPDVRQWNDDDVLSYLLIEGFDLPGDFVVGDRALERAVRLADDPAAGAVAEANRSRSYLEQAAAAQRGEVVGSSAGGEQPKFLTTVQRAGGGVASVMVKFSAAEASLVSQRWADLLRCEHLAAETMRARGITCAATQVIEAGGRCFLEIERFDRVAVAGRRGVISLGTIEDALLERSSADWAAGAGMLEEGEWITSAEARALRWIWCFGDLIANTDMHRANASFWFGDELPYRLTPFYDMLPMLYAPGSQGELGARNFAPKPPLAHVAEVWSDAAAGAVQFWQRVADDEWVSEPFRLIAATNREIVRRLAERLG